MVSSRCLPILFALLVVGNLPAAHAQTSFKLGTQFNADAGRIDTTSMNWIVGCGSDVCVSCATMRCSACFTRSRRLASHSRVSGSRIVPPDMAAGGVTRREDAVGTGSGDEA